MTCQVGGGGSTAIARAHTGRSYRLGGSWGPDQLNDMGFKHASQEVLKKTESKLTVGFCLLTSEGGVEEGGGPGAVLLHKQ